MHDLLEAQHSGECTLRSITRVLEQLYVGLAGSSLGDDASDVFAGLLDVMGELLTEPVAALPAPVHSADLDACAAYERARNSALGVLCVYASLCRLWETILGTTLEGWCAAVVGRGEAALQDTHERSHGICVEQNRRLVEGLVEATVLISERHGGLLVSPDPFYTSARLVAGSEIGIFVSPSDSSQNMCRLFGCLTAALTLYYLPAASLVIEVLHHPPLVQDKASRNDASTDNNSVDIARLWLPHLMAILRRQVTCRAFSTCVDSMRDSESSLFVEDAQLQQSVLMFELGSKYRDTELLDQVADDNDELSHWLQFRNDSFQLLQGLAGAWPGGSGLFDLIHEAVLSWLQQLTADLNRIRALRSTPDAKGTYSVINTARTTEALLFIWHALLESSLMSNRYDSTSDSNQGNVLRNCTATEHQMQKAVQVLKMTIVVVSHVQHLPPGTEFSAFSLRYRCVKILSLLPEVIGYHLPEEIFPVTHAPSSKHDRAFTTEGARNILELLCNTYEETETGREACVDAFFTISSGRGLRSLFEPHANSLCVWLEATLERAHADAAVQIELSLSSLASQGNPGHAHAAPMRHCHFADKMSLVLGRAITWLIDTETVEKMTARVINSLTQALQGWIEVLQRPASSACGNENLRKGTGMCRYFLGCLEGLVRGLGEASTVTETSHASSGESFGRNDSEDIDRKSTSGSDSAEAPVSALTRAIPELASGLMGMLDALYTLLWRDALLLSNALLVNITDLAEHVAKTACKLLEMPSSESTATCEDVANLLLSHGDHILTQIHSLDASSRTFRYCFHAMGGLVELVISGTRWTSPEHGEAVLQVLSRALASAAHLFDIEAHVCVCEQIQFLATDSTTASGSVTSDANAYPSPPEGFASDMLCLSALLRLVRQACASWPGLLSPSASPQQTGKFGAPSGINKSTNQGMLLYTLDVIIVATRVLSYHFDAAMIRNLSAAWTALLDIPRSTRESRDKETRARSSTLSDDDILLSSCLREKLITAMSTLLMESTVLPSPRLMRVYTSLVGTFFASFPSSQQHAQAATQLSEGACRQMSFELQRRGRWPCQAMALRLQAVHAAIVASVSVHGTGTSTSQAASLKIALCSIAAGKLRQERI